MINFGVGHMIAIPTLDSTGSAITNPTPVILGTMQEITVDLSVEMKTLYGSRRYPIAIGQGRGTTEIKAKYADIDAAVLGSLFYGKTPAAGIKAAVIDAAPVAIPATPFQITVAPPSSGTFVADLGVRFSATGVQLTRVASAPVAGQYAVNGSGQYTFASADTGKLVVINYEYSAATGGQVFTLTNDVMGVSPAFSMILQNSYLGKTLAMKLTQCVSGSLNLPLKSDDFAIYEFAASAFADSSGSLGYICLI